jgi:hypothetical protein
MSFDLQGLKRLSPAERILDYSELPESIHGNSGLSVADWHV